MMVDVFLPVNMLYKFLSLAVFFFIILLVQIPYGLIILIPYS